MMKDSFSFFNVAHIHVQGFEALHLNHRHNKYAEFKLIGFHNIVTIKDFRLQSLQAIDNYLSTHQTLHFPQEFNKPALTKMVVNSPYNIKIELFDTHEADPPFRLWANIGSKDGIPVYKYLYKRIQPMDKDRFAFLALYLRSPIQVKKREPCLDVNEIRQRQLDSPSLLCTE